MVAFKENKMNASVSVDEKSTQLTFVDLDSEKPAMIGNLGDKSELSKIDNGSVIYLIEKTGFKNLNVFTLFRDKNIVTMSKQYNMIGMPFGLMMIGDCLSGI